MSELLSLVVTVRPLEPASVPLHLGRAVHALLLRWLDGYDAALARRWHDDDGLKPFTCSALVGGRRTGANTRSLAPGQDCWFRLTSLDPEVSAALLARQQEPPKKIDLDGTIFQVISMATSDHPWAGATSYQDIAAPYLLAREQSPRRLKLEFVSPAAFRHNDMNMPIPLPELVFGGLCDRWNAFSPVAVGPEVRAYCQTCVALNNFRLRSRGLPMKDGGFQVGSTGVSTYVAVRFDRYWMSVLGLLADFAFYAGVGRLTSAGMGQARRVE